MPVEESDENEEEVVDEKLDRNEAELRKISTGMCQVFLTEIAVERERRRYAKKRMIDPRSAARTPSASREPQYRFTWSPCDQCLENSHLYRRFETRANRHITEISF
jgi:hypothetical protein